MKKRIALGVVAALVGALVAVTPASAAPNAILTYAVGDGAPAGDLNTGAGVAGPANTVSLNLAQNGTLRQYVTVSGAGSIILSLNAVAVNGAAALQATGGATQTVVISTPQVGTITANVFKETAAGSGIFSTTAAETVTITVAATASSGVYSNTKSTAVMAAAAGAPAVAGTDDTLDPFQAALPSGQAANVLVTVKDALGAALNGKTITAMVAGPGVLGAGANANQAATGRAVSYTPGGNTGYVTIWSDGTAGVATVSIYVGTTLLATKKVTFYGDVATLSAVNAKNYIAHNVNTTDVIAVTAKDANGVAVPNLVLTATSGDTTIAGSAAVVPQVTAGVYHVTVNSAATAKAGKVTITIADSVLTTVKTTASVTLSKTAVGTAALTLDKASYAPGEKATLTLTVKDADGTPVPDGTYATLLTAAAGASALSTSTGLTAAFFTGGSVTLVDGVAKVSFFAPLVAGPLSFAGVLPKANTAANADIALSASATVAPSADAAAQQAAISALQTSVASLQTTVASLVASMTAQIKVINAALKKIAKKLQVKL